MIGLAATALATLTAAAPFQVSSSLADGQSLTGQVRWEASPAGATADRVEFVVDGWVRHVEKQAPFVFEWDTGKDTDGTHTVELWAVARDGRVARASATVTTHNRFELEVAAPARAKGSVKVRADVEGMAPEWVEIVVDGQLRATDSDAPYEWTWNTPEERGDRHTVSIWAVATNGRVATAKESVEVLNAGLPVLPGSSVARYRQEAWRWESLMGRKRSGGPHDPEYWRKRAAEARRQASRPPHWKEFLCIHRYEGAWTANTGNGYFGGLQMNMDFMRAYGPELLRTKGTADKWTPLEQIWVAERAVPGRGYRPWPQTARMCGLLP